MAPPGVVLDSSRPLGPARVDAPTDPPPVAELWQASEVITGSPA
ncbi:hypothetical protein [Microbacterium hatanonis]|nr:hypothetical protein [Microbacterium hatanonis]